MLPERDRAAGDDEIEAALASYHALFGGAAHDATPARAARARRCAWMRRLAPFGRRCWSAASRRAGRPSTATSGSSSSPTIAKAVEMALANGGVRVRGAAAHASGDRRRRTSLIETRAASTAARRDRSRRPQRRNRPRKARGAATRRRGALAADSIRAERGQSRSLAALPQRGRASRLTLPRSHRAASSAK